MKPVQLRAILAAVIAIAAAVAATMPAAADTALGGAVGTSSYSEAGHTVTGTGTWELWGDDSDQVLTIAFECASIGTPDAVSSSVHPPAYGGCYLVRNGITIATAPGITLPGPVAATQATAAFSLYNTLSLLVCWHTYASFRDGYLLQTTGCSNISVIDSIPRYQLGDNITDDNNPIYQPGFAYAIGTGGQNESGRVVCATTTGSTSDCVVGVTGTGTSTNDDVSASGTGSADGGCDWVCVGVDGSTATLSGTGPAGSSCNTVIAISATNDACGVVAVSGIGNATGGVVVSGTGNATGGYAISGTGYATGSAEEFSGREEVCLQAHVLC